MGSNFAASVVALVLHLQAVADMFMMVLLLPLQPPHVFLCFYF